MITYNESRSKSYYCRETLITYDFFLKLIKNKNYKVDVKIDDEAIVFRISYENDDLWIQYTIYIIDESVHCKFNHYIYRGSKFDEASFGSRICKEGHDELYIHLLDFIPLGLEQLFNYSEDTDVASV